jgi:hypothetical protein
MSGEHFDRLFPAVCAGFGLMLVGGVNLLLLRQGLAVRVLATLLAVGLAVGFATALDHPGAAAATARILAVGLLPCAILGSRRVVDALAGSLSALRRPGLRFGILSAAGVATAIGAVVVFERADEQMMAEAESEMDLVHSRVPTTPTQREKAATDRGTPVVLKEPAATLDGQKLSAAEGKILRDTKLGDQVMRRGPIGDHSNCHGWVFAGGRFWLNPDDVELILKENGYAEAAEPQVGDVVIYRNGGVISHSAVVRYVAEGQPAMVEGKWGQLGVFLHPADKSCYGTSYTFYRANRASHLLVGLGGTPGSDAKPPVVTE